MKKEKSEFGEGFIYNLILFAKHWGEAGADMDGYEKTFAEKYTKEKARQIAIILWFSGASDHFYDFKIPKQFEKTEIGKLAKWIQDKCLYWGHSFEKEPTEKNFREVFEKLEKLAMLIDKKLGVKDIEADYK